MSQPRAAAPATGAANCTGKSSARIAGGPGESSSRRASAPTRNASSRPLQTPHTDDLPWEPLRRSSLYRHSEHSLPPRASSQRRRRTAVTGCRCSNFGCLLQRLCAALRRMRAAPAPRRGQADADDNKPPSYESLIIHDRTNSRVTGFGRFGGRVLISRKPRRVRCRRAGGSSSEGARLQSVRSGKPET